MSTDCSNCGQPPGECYHLCFNSDHYYSPEQERADEPFYGDDDVRERYADEVIDAETEQRYADEQDGIEEGWTPIVPAPILPADDNDIPF